MRFTPLRPPLSAVRQESELVWQFRLAGEYQAEVLLFSFSRMDLIDGFGVSTIVIPRIADNFWVETTPAGKAPRSNPAGSGLSGKRLTKKTGTHYLVSTSTTAVIASKYWYFLVVPSGHLIVIH